MEMQTCVFDVICWEIYGPIVRWADRRNNPLKVAQFSSLHFLPGFKSLLLTSYSVVSSSQMENCRRLTSRHPFPSFSFSFQFSPFLRIFPPYVSSSVHKVSIFYIHLGWQVALWIVDLHPGKQGQFSDLSEKQSILKVAHFLGLNPGKQFSDPADPDSPPLSSRCRALTLSLSWEEMKIKFSFVKKLENVEATSDLGVRCCLLPCQLIWDQLLSNHFPTVQPSPKTPSLRSEKTEQENLICWFLGCFAFAFYWKLYRKRWLSSSGLFIQVGQILQNH